MARLLDKDDTANAVETYHAASVTMTAVSWLPAAQAPRPADAHSASAVSRAPASDASILTVSGDVRVNTLTANAQTQPSITTLNDGSYVMAWTGQATNTISGIPYNETNIYSQKYTAAGIKIGAQLVFSDDRPGNAFRPVVIGDDSGGYWVYYTDKAPSFQITFFYLVHVDAAGSVVAPPAILSTDVGSVELTGASIPSSRAATLSDGGHVFVYQGNTGIATFDIFFFRMLPDGSFVSTVATKVNTTTAGTQSLPDVTGLSDGGFVVTWTSEAQDGSDYGIYSRRYNAGTAPIGGEVLVNTTTAGYQYAPVTTALSDGGYVIAWMSYDQDGSAYGIFGQRFDSAGLKIGTEFQINTYTPGDQSVPDITGLTDGGFVVTWISDGDIYAQRFDTSAHVIGPETRINTYTTGDQVDPVVTALDGGGFAIAWQSLNQDGSSWGIYQKVFAPSSTLTGGQQLYGTQDADRLDGGAGNDTLYGGYGDDTYVVGSSGDIINEVNGQGTDLVESAVTFILAPDLEHLTLTGLSAINGTGNAADNLLTGNSAANQLVAGAGDDTISGGLGSDTLFADDGNDLLGGGDGNDILYGGVGSDTFDGGNGDDSMLDGAGDDYMSGGSGNDSLSGAEDDDALYGGDGNDSLDGGIGDNDLYGNAGRDTLSAGAGNDGLSGGDGDDLIYASAGQDSAAGDGGFDTFSAQFYGQAVTINLADLTMTDALGNVTLLNSIENITGSAAADVLTGDAGNNVIDGGLGGDTLTGGAGNDTFVVDTAGDVTTELLGGGTDIVRSSITWTIGNYIEILILTGLANIDAIGNAGVNILTGNSGNNLLDGGKAADTLIGGAGNDTYAVDSAGDVVTELAAQGTDTVNAALSWTLGANIENLTLTGSALLNGTGNALANIITGNSAANLLDGGAGADTLAGGAGMDTYIVDDPGDVVTELASQGTDTVNASLSWTLAVNLENLSLTGSANIDATGNSQANTIIGNSGNNVINGGAGTDLMTGGLGNDTYYVDNTTDKVFELAGGGNDTVRASATFSLVGQYVETLILAGSANINGAGQDLDNALFGNNGNNTLDGGAGSDTLNGGLGADTLIGGLGADAFVFSLKSAADRINDFNAAQNDVININAYTHGVVNGGGVVISQVGADTLINLGGGNTITVLATTATNPAFLGHIVW